MDKKDFLKNYFYKFIELINFNDEVLSQLIEVSEILLKT